MKPIISVKPMELSSGDTDYYVSVQVGDRETTPFVFRNEEFKAQYEAATFEWLLNGADEPDILDYNENDWPGRTTLHKLWRCNICGGDVSYNSGKPLKGMWGAR